MTEQKSENTKTKETARDRFYAEFQALPLDKKFESLFKMEAATLTEAFDYVVTSPMKVVEKVGDVINDFGSRIQTEVRNAARKAEAYTPPQAAKDKKAKPKPRAARRPKASPPPKA